MSHPLPFAVALPAQARHRPERARGEPRADPGHRSAQDPARRPQPRRPDHAHRLRCDASRLRSARPEGGVAVERPRPGVSVQAQPPGSHVLSRQGREAAALQRLLRRRRPGAGEGRDLEAGAGGPHRATSGRGRSGRSTSCPSRRSSSATSASRAGTTSASGPA